jgi:hypothetical protein
MNQEEMSKVLLPTSPPRILENVYTKTEIERLFGAVRQYGPWNLVIKHHFSSLEELTGSVGPQDSGKTPTLESFVTPVFRGFLADNGVCLYDELCEVFYNPRFMDYARHYWGGARYAQPYMMLFNLQAPGYCFDPGHLDSPGFRGMWHLNTPIWLLSAMARSGLFKRWMLRTAQVIAWFYDSDEDGGFTYWPDGPLAPPARLAAPMWNKGVVVQNEYLCHRGEASGPRHRRPLPAGFSFDSTISADPDSTDGWQIKTGETVLRKVPHGEMRYLFHWDGEVFMDGADMKRRFDHLDDITPDRAMEMLMTDMRARGVAFEVPSDPMNDRQFIALVSRTYFLSPASYPPEAVPDVAA